MQVPAATNLAGLAASELVPLLRVLSGQVPNVVVGSILPAQVTATSPGQVQVTVNGQPLVLKGTPLLKEGDQVFLRVPGAKGSLELLGKQPPGNPAANVSGQVAGNNAGQTTNTATPQNAPPVLDSRGNPVPTPPRLPQQGSTPTSAGGQTPVRGNPGNIPVTPQPGQNLPTQGNVRTTVTPPTGNATPAGNAPQSGNATPAGTVLARTPVATGPSPDLRVAAPVTTTPGANTSAGIAATPGTPTQVQVLDARPGNQYLVRMQGQTTVAQSQEPLQPGGRYLLQVDRSAMTVQLQPLTPSQVNPVAVATAVLKANPGVEALPQLLQPLQQEIQNVSPQPVVREAVQQVQQTLGSLLPDTGQPLDAQQLQNWVEKGGLLHEAKAASTDLSSSLASTTPEKAPVAERPASLGDLKGSLLSLLQSNASAGDSPAVLPQSHRALGAIEALQALNVLMQQQGEPYQLQFPFPDGERWRSANLSFEPESDGKGSRGQSQSNRFRMLMNIDLTSLGEVWIDTAVSPQRLDATIYVGSDQARTSVSQELPGLKKELIQQGFSTVELNLRSATDLPAKQRARAEAMKKVRVDGMSLLDVRA